MSATWVLAGVTGLALLGLVAYPLARSRLAGRSAGRPASSGHPTARVGATEALVDVDAVRDFALLTSGGDLVAMLEVHPFVLTTTVSPEAVGAMFAQAIRSMPDGETWQIAQIPGTQSIEAYTDRLARLAHGWVEQLSEAQALGSELAPCREHFQRRLSLPATLGALLLEQAATADLALRRTFVAVAHPALACRGAPPEAPVWVETLEALRRRMLEASMTFREAGLAVRELVPAEMLEVLWHAYNPGAASDGVVQEQRQRRFAEILDDGTPCTLYTAAVTEEEIARAMGEAERDPMALRRLIAPRSWEERDDAVIVNDRVATTTYFVENFSYDLMPSLARILGDYAGRLHVAMYVRAPERAEVVEQARKGSVARQAAEMVRGAYGQIQDYKAAQEIHATEELRARAEMGLETPRYLGMYLTLFGRGAEDLEAVRSRFEVHLRNQGVRFVCARWQQEFAFRTAVPLAQRHHRFADRNLAPDNFAALCPCGGNTYFEPSGYLHAFLRPGGESLASQAPLVLDRLRGGDAPGASEALVGSPRSGKSVTLKTLALTWLAQDHTVIVIDPKAEYGPLAAWAGGEVATLAGADGAGFNLFHFDRLEADGPRARRLAANTFADNLNALLTLYAFLKDSSRPFVSGPERSLLTRALRLAMERVGMDSQDPSSWDPDRLTLTDVYAVLAQELRQEDTVTAGVITATLQEHATESGQFYALYNTPRRVRLEADLSVIQFGIAGLHVAGFERALAHHFALRLAASAAVGRFLRTPNPAPVHIIVDEASQVLVDEHMVSTVVKMLSTLPSFGVTLHLAFQDAHALARADRFGQAGEGSAQSVNTLLGTLGTYWLFYQTPASAREIGERLELSREEIASLPRLKVGEAILALPDQQRLPVRVVVPQPWLPIFETDMLSMRRNLEGALEAAEAQEGAV